jgi:protein-tyrosine phosphatase
MAVGIVRDCFLTEEIEVLARGLVVAFPEPMNQKAEAVLISNGIDMSGFTSLQLSEKDVDEDTLILTMEADHRDRLLRLFPNIDENQVFVLTEFVGDELEIIDPYGGSLAAYGLCYESMKKTLKKLVKILNEGE